MAKKAVEAGLVVKPYIQTSLAPGSGMVTRYLSTSGVLPYLSQLGWACLHSAADTNKFPTNTDAGTWGNLLP